MRFFFRKLNGGIKRIIIFFYKDAFPQNNIQKPDDPEMLALFSCCKGLGIDVGCGSRKTHPLSLGVDITPKGIQGKFGSENRIYSKADICTSGDNLYMFADNVLDYIVSRHTLEHFTNPKKALLEWKRVLKKGGKLGIVLPDEEKIRTIKLDPTHKQAFTMRIIQELIIDIGGFKISKLKPCTPTSFVVIASKV